MLKCHGLPVRRRARVVAPAQLVTGIADHNMNGGCCRAVRVQVQAALLVHRACAFVLVVVPRECHIDLRSRVVKCLPQTVQVRQTCQQACHTQSTNISEQLHGMHSS
jgi:hypothetical protein